MSSRILELLGPVRVIPVLTITDAADAVPLAKALVQGGLTVLEVTFRTDAAQEAIRRIVGEVPEATVGAGTVTQPQHFAEAEWVGAKFAVSPGTTGRLLTAAASSSLAYLPAAVTASEAMALAEQGYTHLKFFPARASGGTDALAQLAAPLPNVSFCPTGGLDQENAADYLASGNVFAVGGSWPAPARLIAAKDWDGIAALARTATAL